MKKKIFIIGSAGIPASYGGFETYAENISLVLCRYYDISVICSRKLFNKQLKDYFPGLSIKRIYIPVRANGIFSLFYDLISIIIAAFKADFIIMLGSGAGIFLPFFSLFKKVIVATHIDGFEWERGKWNKLIQVYLYISTHLTIKFSKFILVDNPVLYVQIPQKYKQKILSTTYGGEHLPQISAKRHEYPNPYALMITRAEPENNIHLILEVFKNSEPLDLVVISNWEYTRYGRLLHKQYKNFKNIKMYGPIYDDRIKLQEYRRFCKVYLHGHSAGGTNPSLVEAMYSGVPIIAYDNDFNRETTNNLAEYFRTSDELLYKIRYVLKEDLSLRISQMYEFATKNYTWNNAVDSILKVLT